MECCNKDEAARAKALAERKLLDKDFVGAKKLIIKARQLSKEVGDTDIPKMLTVCDVHCAAGAKENAQIDWYGILQVPETADDALIKKQYHKLSLLLHPDKNKFGGAEAAFKLVGEANESLTDRSKHSLYDMKRVRATQRTFWTICPSCGMKYQYYIVVLMKTVCCQSCSTQFIAHELKEQAVPYGEKQRCARAVVESSESSISETSRDNEEERFVVESNESSMSETSSDNEEDRAVVESSESSISETSSDVEEEIADHDPAANGSGQGQRSRQMEEVMYNEEKVDDDFVNSPSLKRLRKSGMFCGDDNKKAPKLVEEIVRHNGMADGDNNCSTTEDEREGGSSMHGLNLFTDDASDVVPQGDTLRFSHCIPHLVVSGTEKEGISEKSLELDPAALSLNLVEDFPSIAQVVSIMHGSAAHDLMEQAVPSGVNQQYAGVWKNASVPQKSPGPQTNVTAQKAWSATPGLNIDVASHHAGENAKRETATNTAGPQDKMKSDHAARNPSKASSTAGLKRGRRAVVECSESSISATSSDSEEEIDEHDPAANGSGPVQRTHISSSQKQEVKYNEEIDDEDNAENDKVDDFVNFTGLKRLRKSFMFHGDHSNKATNLNKEIAGHNGLTNSVTICSNTRKKKVGAHAPCGEKSFNKIQQMERETMHGGETGDGKEKEFHSGRSNGLGLNNDDASDEYKFTFVDPEFFDFGQLRDENEFRTNQIWAVCDDQGCMPRFYAQITKVKTMPNFMLHFVWLEFDPTNKVEATWSFSGLPVACGRFKYGKSDTAKETGMFSRTISFEKSKTRNCFEIYPREGEVWALFKGWDVRWSSEPDNHKYLIHQYEVVQVLSDLTTSSTIIVMPLVKIKGYDNIFMQSREAAPYVIPQGDTLRFSHCIPHHVMCAIEERVPEAYLELDHAVLPIDLEFFPSVIPECSSERSQERDAKYAGSSIGNRSREGSMSVGEGQYTTSMNAGIAAKTPKKVNSQNISTTASDEDHGDKCASSSSGNSSHRGSLNVGEGQHTPCMNAGIAAETPKEENSKRNTCSVEVTDVDEDKTCQIVCVDAESEFYDFSQIRLLQKFSPGNIWALYNDVDQFPSYYGFIQKVDLKNGKIQVRWLDVCPCGDEEKRLLQEERTIACGTFRLSRVHELMIYTNTNAFSHCVVARSTGQKGKYEIIPHPGEIWAVYKNWSVGWTAQDFGRCEYELVEILGHTASSIQVQLLRKMDGYRMVFMRCQYGAEGSVKTIRKNEYPKFSHQIPCFRLTCEEGGKLRGCLELDPLSLPEEFLNVR